MLWGLIKPNDWQKIHAATANFASYKMYEGYKIEPSRTEFAVICYLEYSPSRNKTRIDWDHIIPDNREKCSAYQECVRKEIEFWKDKNK